MKTTGNNDIVNLLLIFLVIPLLIILLRVFS